MHLLRFRKHYGRFLALEIDNLYMDNGVYWLKGDNGSGKSTFLRAMAGMLDFEGEIYLTDQISLKHNPVAYRKLVNFAEAEPVFPEFLSGTELLKLFAYAKGAMEHQVETLVNLMNLNDIIHQPVGSYSSGMLKKLSIALAFLGKPSMILLDEPFITLDKDALEVLRRLIEAKHNEERVSFIIASHQSPELSPPVHTRELYACHRTITHPE